jgi:hypothetical protein
MSYATQRNTARFVKSYFEDEDVEAALQTLDRLTRDEARMVAVEVLRVVHGLVHTMNATLDGEQTHSDCHQPSVEHGPF